jgi:hypothetical protein
MSLWIAGAAIGGALIGSKGAKDAAKTQAGAAGEASDIVRQNYLDTKETLQPYADSGIPALNRRNILMGLSGTPEQRQSEWGSVYNDPVLTQQNQLATDAVNRMGAAGGMTNSGNRLAALNDRLQRLQYEFGQNYLNRLDTSVNTGYGAAAATGGVAANAANTQANLVNQAGMANAQGQLGAAQSWGSGLADLAGVAAYRFSRPGGSGGSGGGTGGWQGTPPINGGSWT